MNENTIRSLRRDMLRVMGRDPMADGATFEEAKRQYEEHLQREGAKVRDPNPCHCYDHCEDDDEGVVRRPSCRKRD